MSRSIASAIAVATLLAVGITSHVGSAEAAQSRTMKSYKSAKFNKAAIARSVRRQAKRKGVRLSRRQVNAAVNRAIGGFKSNGPGVQKIIIRINTKRLDICIATGRHRGACG
jgi:hypothetical protein